MPARPLTPDDFRRIRQIFEAALDRPQAARRAYVSSECADAPWLMSEVEQMLAGDDEVHALLDGDEQATRDAARREAPVECPSCHAPLDAGDRFCRSCGTPVASGSIGEEGRFRPGALFADRFRIVSMLGRGGMGEVYRAHDLELGQPVALKFLTALRHDERARARLRTEVRLARQIAHSSVCRVYDIGEVHGDLYLSMEYVDGEDLAALLKRIGRLPIDKGIEIARKLCAGLAAAHGKGVLHRDLKPGNIMIDGRGEVRIMDFGLAAIAEDVEPPDVHSGTPAYMAPEQLAGREVTIRSDVYALGLVLYELFTGQPPFSGTDAQRLLRERESHPATAPSALIPDLNPRIERTILQCLDPDPRLRPASTLEVAATLPGGDPLAEALAAGITPSPELVAAAGDVGVISPAYGLICLSSIVIGVTGIIWMSYRTTITSHVPIERPVQIMAERTRTILEDLGYFDPRADLAYGYHLHNDVLQRIANTDQSVARWNALRTDRLTALGFWYRQSPQSLVPVWVSADRLGMVTLTNPPQNIPGMVSIETDPAGRLARLIVGPAPTIQSEAAQPSTPPDWARVFRHAGLDIDRFNPSAPQRVPPFFADQREAWEGVLPNRREVPVRVEAAAHGGKPIYFEVVTPWSDDALASSRRLATPVAVVVLDIVIFAVSLFVARHNVRLGRADRRGAFRTGAVITIATFVANVWVSPDASALVPFAGDGLVLAAALWAAIIPWVFYVALEPYVRRVWPEMLIGWTRLLSGRIRDPLVGRDVLVGTVAGVLLACVVHLRFLVPAMLGLSTPTPVGPAGSRFADQVLTMLATGWQAVGLLPLAVVNGLSIGLLSAVTLVLLTIVLRGRRRAAVAWVLVWTVAQQVPSPGDPIVDFAFKLIAFTIGMLVLVRFGLLAMAVHLIPNLLLTLTSLRFDSSAPQAAASYVLVGAVALMALYGLHTALGQRSLLGLALLRADVDVSS